jgi:hypothetical protein
MFLRQRWSPLRLKAKAWGEVRRLTRV